MFDFLISKGTEPHCPYSDYGCEYEPLAHTPFFQCFDCFTNSDHSICPECAMLCHGTHNIQLIEGSYFTRSGYYCDCGAGQHHRTHPCHICKQPGPNDQCTFFANNGQSTNGKYYICKTCSSSMKICPSCANFCHSGHDLEENEGDFTCDCGQNNFKNTCLFS